MALAYVGIGSNLGDRFAHLEAALAGIAGIGAISGGSPTYETAPIGEIDQDAFLNAVVALETDLAPLGESAKNRPASSHRNDSNCARADYEAGRLTLF